MCFSFKTSIISYTLGIIAAVIAFLTNQIALGVLILFFSQIQLSEALIWRGIDTKNDGLNRFGTIYGKYMLPTHLFALGLGIILEKLKNGKTLKKIDYLPISLGVIFYLYVYFNVYNKQSKQEINDNLTYPLNKSENKCSYTNRLKWNYPTSWYIYGFIATFIVICFNIRKMPYGIFTFSMYTLALLISIYFFRKYNSVSTIWCFAAAVISPIVVLLNFYLFPKNYKLYKDFN